MVKYFMNINGEYISSISTGTGDVEITQEEYENLLSVIRNRPIPEKGYDFKLRIDLTWESVECPIVEEDAEATEEDYIAILAELGVTVDEES